MRREVWYCYGCGSWWPGHRFGTEAYWREYRDPEEWPCCPVCPEADNPLSPVVLVRRRGSRSPHLRAG